MGSRVKIQISTLLFSVFFLLSCTISASAASLEGGKDVNPESDDVPFSIAERTTPSQDFIEWTLSLQMDEEPMQNGTTFEITTQICLNNGVCDPPVVMDLDGDTTDGVYSVSLKPPTDHTYVNWRVKAMYDDGSNDVFPYGDWYKTWSTCWYNDGEYGGIHSTNEGCDVPAALEDEESLLPYVSTIAVISMIAGASIVYARR